MAPRLLTDEEMLALEKKQTLTDDEMFALENKQEPQVDVAPSLPQPTEPSWDEGIRRVAANISDPVGSGVDILKGIAHPVESFNKLFSPATEEAPSWENIGGEAVRNLPGLAANVAAGILSSGSSVPVQIGANLLATGVDYGAQKIAETTGLSPERDDSLGNLISLGTSFIPLAGGVVNKIRKGRFLNEAAVPSSKTLTAAKLGAFETNAAPVRKLGEIVSDEDVQRHILTRELDRGETFDPVANKMTGNLPPNTTREAFNANLQRNIDFISGEQDKFVIALDDAADNAGVQIIGQDEIGTLLGGIRDRYLTVQGINAPRAGEIAEAIDSLIPLVSQAQTLSQLQQQIKGGYKLLKDKNFFSLSKKAQIPMSPEVAASINTSYNEGLINVIDALREFRQGKISELLSNQGVASALPPGSSAQTFSNMSEFIHHTIPMLQVSESTVAGMGRAASPTQGRLIPGASEAAPTNLASKVQQNIWQKAKQVLGFPSYERKLLEEQTAQLGIFRDAIDFVRRNPQFQKWQLPTIINHPMFISDLMNKKAVQDPQNGTSSELKGSLPIILSSRSIGRNVAEVSAIPPEIKGLIFNTISNEVDGPALLEMEMQAKQPSDKAKFWTAVAKRYPMLPLASANITGLNSEFDDGTGPKLYDDMDKQTWSEQINRSPIREDAKAQLTAALFRDGTVYPLDRAYEVSVPMQSQGPTTSMEIQMMRDKSGKKMDATTGY